VNNCTLRDECPLNVRRVKPVDDAIAKRDQSEHEIAPSLSESDV